jgi:hypothetical protein
MEKNGGKKKWRQKGFHRIRVKVTEKSFPLFTHIDSHIMSRGKGNIKRYSLGSFYRIGTRPVWMLGIDVCGDESFEERGKRKEERGKRKETGGWGVEEQFPRWM